MNELLNCTCHNFLIRLHTIYFDELPMILYILYRYTEAYIKLGYTGTSILLYMSQYINIVSIKTKVRKHLSNMLFNL